MPSACPRCRSPWNLQQRLPFNDAQASLLECGDCGWAGLADELVWLSADEVDG